jgi:hypothetical protein
MTVAELIKVLRTFPKDLPVAYHLYSEAKLMEVTDLRLEVNQPARADGWVHYVWPGKPKLPEVTYLMFPGN